MIATFRHRGLKELFEDGKTRRIDGEWHARLIRQMDVLDDAERPQDMNIPDWRFHSLQGYEARYSITVSANYRLTFDWQDGAAHRVDLEDYH
jgi:proteic killer suppression protein